MFVDEITITVESGSGGRGCESFRQRSDHKRVPDGGDGGKGGDIIFRADQNISGLEDFIHSRVIQAGSGEAGGANFRTGRSSKPIIVRIPCGTLLMNRDANLRIRDLTDDGDEVIVAKGGRGGAGNQHGHSARIHEKGQIVHVDLILKLICDAAIVGLPNSGKSSLLNCLTHANVKVESYPFSSKFPQLGVMETSDYKQLRICELPGLLKGACEGKGLGNKFLRHLERTRLIILLLDPFNAYQLSALENYKMLLYELRCYNGNILDIPRIIVINKSESRGFAKVAKQIQSVVKEPVFSVSALKGDGVDGLKKKLEQLAL